METPLRLSCLWLGHGASTRLFIMLSDSAPVGRPAGVILVKNLFDTLCPWSSEPKVYKKDGRQVLNYLLIAIINSFS